MKAINLYMDESGNLGTNGRYFLICALEIKEQDAKSLGKRAGRIINRFKIKYNIPKTREVKGWMLNHKERVQLIEHILYRGIKIRYIILDLNHTTMLLKKADDKNACYNYLVQLIIKKLIQDYPQLKKVNIYLDNRSVKIGNRLSLKPYLYNKLVLEQLETKENVNRIEFQTYYMESNKCYLIEWADIIANAIYKKYNSNVDEYYKQIKPFIIFESKFPSKTFGTETQKNWQLKEVNAKIKVQKKWHISLN